MPSMPQVYTRDSPRLLTVAGSQADGSYLPPGAKSSKPMGSR